MTRGSRTQPNNEGAALLGMNTYNCSAPLLQLQEDAPKDGWQVTAVPSASLGGTRAVATTEQWRGVRSVRELGGGWEALLSGAGKQQPWQPGRHPSPEPDGPSRVAGP